MELKFLKKPYETLLNLANMVKEEPMSGIYEY